MAFHPSYELSDREWDEITEIVQREADTEGVTDLSEMLLFMKKGWGILIDPTLRRRQLDHQRHKQLTARADATRTRSAELDAEVASLPPDPGPPEPTGFRSPIGDPRE